MTRRGRDTRPLWNRLLQHVHDALRQSLVPEHDVELGRGGDLFQGFQLAQAHERWVVLEQLGQRAIYFEVREAGEIIDLD